jgi:hypothetical protein
LIADKEKIRNALPGIALAEFEVSCLIKMAQTVLHSNSYTYSLVDFDANLTQIFVKHPITQYAVIILCEYVEVLAVVEADTVEEFKELINYSLLRKLRNKLHLFQTRQNWKVSADIISSQISNFSMDVIDEFFYLRNDISLFIEIAEEGKLFCGTNYLYLYMLRRIDELQNKQGSIQNIITNVFQALRGLTDHVRREKFNLADLEFSTNNKPIAGIDYKSADLFARLELEESTTFRLLLSLTLISYSLYLQKNLFDSVRSDDLWYCFSCKFLAIAFDEAVDNINNMLKHPAETEKSKLRTIFSECNFDAKRLKSIEFARQLRNTLHYEKTRLDTSLIENTTASYVKALYISNTSIATMDEFRESGDQLLNDSLNLQRAIRQIFKLDGKF